MGLTDWFSGSPEDPEKRVLGAVSEIGAEIESLIRTVEEHEEKLVMYEENIKQNDVNTKSVNKAEQKVGDIIIYFEKHATAIEEHIQEARLALEEVNIDQSLRKKAQHNVNLAETILEYLEKEVSEMKQEVEEVERHEGRREINELEEIQRHDEKVLEGVEKMFQGQGQYRDNPDYGWISIS